MKILLVTYKNDYDNRWNITARKYSAPYFLFYEPLVKLARKRGWTISPFWIDEVTRQYGRSEANVKLMETIFREGPDVAIVYGCEYDMDKKALRRIQEQSDAVSIYFCGDDSWSFDSVSKHFARYFSWVVTWYSKAVSKYYRLGCKNVIGSQVWVDIESYKPIPGQKSIDVSFVGTWNRARGNIVRQLRKAGIEVYTRGNGWPEGGVSQEEMLRVLSHSKISISLSPPAFSFNIKQIARLFVRRAYLGEGGHAFKFDAHHFFRNVRSWLQKRIVQLKGRCFEIPACGTLEMTQPADNLADYYEPGKEIVFYNDTQDLISKIRYYLDHDEEREQIARSGYERTIREHTFESRMDAILSKVGVLK